MAKRVLSLILVALAVCLCAASAFAELTVERNEGEMYFPDEQNWVYHFTYAYPQIVGDDYTAALINDTYQMALDEMTRLVLPMFANAPDMRFDGKNEVSHDFLVTCNNDRLLSIVQLRSQEMGEETVYSLEPLTFDVSGMYAGETLTLRGVILIQASVDPEQLEDVRVEDYPEIAHIIGVRCTVDGTEYVKGGSSAAIADALLPALYQRFLEDGDGIRDNLTLEDFEIEFSASRDFSADEEGNLVFYFPPMLMRDYAEGQQLLSVTLSPAEIEAILADAPFALEEQ